jgi:outer membrane protein OmpA-like peptidoglycan-associated protein
MNSAQTDLYRVALPEAVRPNPVVIIKGKTLDAKTNKPIATEVVFESLGDGKKQGSVQSDSITGEYQIILNSGINYGFYAKNDDGYPVSEHLDLTKLDTYREMTKDLTIERIDSGSTISMQNIFFDVNEFTLREESKPELARLIAIMDSFPDMQVQINGHTDMEGSPAYNMYLSKNRATAVRLALLASSNIHGSRLTVQGFGGTQPVADNTTEAGRQLNRRVEFQILRSGEKRNPYAQLNATGPDFSRIQASRSEP